MHGFDRKSTVLIRSKPVNKLGPTCWIKLRTKFICWRYRVYLNKFPSKVCIGFAASERKTKFGNALRSSAVKEVKLELQVIPCSLGKNLSKPLGILSSDIWVLLRLCVINLKPWTSLVCWLPKWVPRISVNVEGFSALITVPSQTYIVQLSKCHWSILKSHSMMTPFTDAQKNNKAIRSFIAQFSQ